MLLMGATPYEQALFESLETMLLWTRVRGMRALLDNPGIGHKLAFLGL